MASRGASCPRRNERRSSFRLAKRGPFCKKATKSPCEAGVFPTVTAGLDWANAVAEFFRRVHSLSEVNQLVTAMKFAICKFSRSTVVSGFLTGG